MKTDEPKVVPHHANWLRGNFLVVGHVSRNTGVRTLPKSINENYREKIKQHMELSGAVKAEDIQYTPEQIDYNRRRHYQWNSKSYRDSKGEVLIKYMKQVFGRWF